MAEETQKRKKRRPKITDKETKSKIFTLKIKPSTFRELNRICVLRQLETGIRVALQTLLTTYSKTTSLMTEINRNRGN